MIGCYKNKFWKKRYPDRKVNQNLTIVAIQQSHICDASFDRRIINTESSLLCWGLMRYIPEETHMVFSKLWRNILDGNFNRIVRNIFPNWITRFKSLKSTVIFFLIRRKLMCSFITRGRFYPVFSFSNRHPFQLVYFFMRSKTILAFASKVPRSS